VLAELCKGDVLMVTRLDRLARSIRDLLNTLAAIAAKKAGFKPLGGHMGRQHDPARAAYAGRPSGLAEFERELIRARTGEGKMGSKFKLTDHQRCHRCGDPAARRRRRNACGHRAILQRLQHDFEASGMNAIILHRTDPAKNMRRFFRLDVQPDLFGQWCFIREWGRIGHAGQVHMVPYATAADAHEALAAQSGARRSGAATHRKSAAWLSWGRKRSAP
jgi:predicted DNA-binding WGR domain protein